MKRKAASQNKTPEKKQKNNIIIECQNKKEIADGIVSKLSELYPNPQIPLHHQSDFQLLVAVILSAQSTDKKVNEVTPSLFELAGDAYSLAQLEIDEIQKVIRDVGLAPTKAKNIKKMSQQLLDLHEGKIPNTLQDLEQLAGVGHKTASVIMCQVFKKPAFPVDTHIHRLSKRWGLTSPQASVQQTEKDLKMIFSQDIWHTLHLQMIYFGREYCQARKHEVKECPICSWLNERNQNQVKC
eukprot:TRINITY_DN9361_c1_g1_i1.p1 TRINITY_DN9361_c1_g1~~TRINITY_DN9361_c1_g1_i1.p1  ORF type:complete len:266 (-),score=9.53 TRINITY_DN9361_c1_g1_i1:65-784(-)